MSLPTPPIVTRAQAQASGAPYYYTGLACKRGHLSMRYTRSQHCCACKAGKPPGSPDMRRAPRLVTLRYAAGSTLEQREWFQKALAEWIAQLDAQGLHIVAKV